MRIVWNLIGLSLCSLFMVSCDTGSNRIALGTVERDAIRLTAPVSEIVTEVLVAEGERVDRNQRILQLDDRFWQAEVSRATAAVSAASAYVTQLENGARIQEIASALAHVTQAEANAEESQKAYERTASLVQKNLLGQAELDAALAKKDTAVATLEDAREKLDLLREGTRFEQLDQARAQLEQAKQALAAVQKQASDLSIVATREGRIDSLPWELGERVPTGAVVAVILTGKPYVRAYVPEMARSQMTIGKSFSVLIDGVDTALSGTLRHIQQDPAFSPHYALTEKERSRLMYLVEVVLDDAPVDLPNGIPAQLVLADQ